MFKPRDLLVSEGCHYKEGRTVAPEEYHAGYCASPWKEHSFAVNITKGGTETSHFSRMVASRWKMALQDTKRHRKFKTDKRDDMLRMQVVDT